MSVISGTVGAVLGSQSAAAANQTNRQNTITQNQANIVLSLMARGGTIDAATARSLNLPPSVVGQAAAVLPYYMGTTEQDLGRLAGQTATTIQAQEGSPEQQYQNYQALMDAYGPAVTANRQTATDLATGAMTGKMLSEFAPVATATTAVAAGERSAALQALSRTLNQIDAIQARKGFSGDSSGNQMLKFNARQQADVTAADAMNKAALSNAVGRAAIQQQGRNMQLQDINLPTTLAGSDILRAEAPGKAVAENATTAQTPLNYFKISGGFAPQSPQPLVNPLPSPLASVAQTGSTVGNSLLNYYLKNNAARLASGSGGGADTGTTSAGGWNIDSNGNLIDSGAGG